MFLFLSVKSLSSTILNGYFQFIEHFHKLNIAKSPYQATIYIYFLFSCLTASGKQAWEKAWRNLADSVSPAAPWDPVPKGHHCNCASSSQEAWGQSSRVKGQCDTEGKVYESIRVKYFDTLREARIFNVLLQHIKSSGAWKNNVKASVILLETHRSARGTCLKSGHLLYFNLSQIYHLYVLFVKILYQARFCLQVSYPAIWFTMLMGFLDCGSFIVHALLAGTSKAFTLSVFLPGVRICILLRICILVCHKLSTQWNIQKQEYMCTPGVLKTLTTNRVLVIEINCNLHTEKICVIILPSSCGFSCSIWEGIWENEDEYTITTIKVLKKAIYSWVNGSHKLWISQGFIKWIVSVSQNAEIPTKKRTTLKCLNFYQGFLYMFM